MNEFELKGPLKSGLFCLNAKPGSGRWRRNVSSQCLNGWLKVAVKSDGRSRGQWLSRVDGETVSAVVCLTSLRQRVRQKSTARCCGDAAKRLANRQFRSQNGTSDVAAGGSSDG